MPDRRKEDKSCINCKTCAIMSGFGGAGAFSDGKYNITNDFGGTLYEYIGKDTAIDLMKYVDEINLPTAEREQRCILLRERILKNFVFKMN